VATTPSGPARGPLPKVVILAGGRGTRLQEETEYRPKPMVEIGGRPVLWHLMKLLAHHGLTEFVVATGYRGQMIKDYFLNYEARNSDFTVTLGQPDAVRYHGTHLETGWEVTVVDTGADTLTGGRVKQVERHLTGDTFMVTYGDGLADVDITELLEFHAAHGKIATVTTTRPLSRFGIVDLEPDQTVARFREKPQGDEWVSSGFFVFERAFLDYLAEDQMLEHSPLERLANEGQIAAYQHDGFWQPMDTYREFLMLEELWQSGKAPWAVWEPDE
jgi:glucose-1-phosphate cytidylyltransferase